MYDNSSEPSSPPESGRGRAKPERVLPVASEYASRAQEHADVCQYLNELLRMLENTRGFFGRRVLVGFKYEEFHTLILKIQAYLPDDVMQARRIRRDERDIVGRANQRASEIINEANTRAERIAAQAEVEAQELRRRAEVDAERVLGAAKDEAMRLVSESEIVRLAQDQARAIVERAQQEAAEIRTGANQYARDVLEKLGNAVSKALAEIERGQELLERNL